MLRASRRTRLLAAASVAALVSAARAAAAAPPRLGADRSKIDTSAYTIDFYEGPVLAGARVIGLAGAYAPIAEGIAGSRDNPASAAQRVPYSTDWFDWELDGGFTLPSSVAGYDFDNNGTSTFAKDSISIFLTGGLGLQFGDLGVGFTVDVRQYHVRSPTTRSELQVDVTRPLLVTAYSFLRGQLVVGAGLGLNIIDMELPGSRSTPSRTLAEVPGTSVHLGAYWAPPRLPLRVGASIRVPPGADTDPSAVPKDVSPDKDGNYALRRGPRARPRHRRRRRPHPPRLERVRPVRRRQHVPRGRSHRRHGPLPGLERHRGHLALKVLAPRTPRITCGLLSSGARAARTSCTSCARTSRASRGRARRSGAVDTRAWAAPRAGQPSRMHPARGVPARAGSCLAM